MSKLNNLIQAMETGEISGVSEIGVHVYPLSFATYAHVKLLMIKENRSRFLIAVGEGPLMDELQGETADGYKKCGLTHENRLILNKYFPYTAPIAFGKQVATLGLGDRLGLASPGHIKTIINRDIKPILAQQSIRELTLTGRDYKQVMDAACYAAFQEGYTGGFGADGDHLKKEEDIQMSLDLGFTMLTLDCSENIDNSIEDLTSVEVEAKYGALSEATRNHFESLYLNQQFDVGGNQVQFDKLGLMKTVLIYHEAINFMVHIYTTYIKNAGRTIDFEISIDETLTSTEPAAHYLIATELYARGVDIFSMAPRFCGEFQKGIDYMGDIAQFEVELAIHAAIADHFGYKLSIHSGSDKFSVFPIIAKYTKGRFHAKTAGTNWLEAVRTVAKVHPSLYRDMHTYALEHVEEALAYYHVSADFKKIKPLDKVSDADLPSYMDEDNARQLIHITYGLLLQAKDASGKSLFKGEFFNALIDQEEQYEQSLIHHIGRHLELLGK
mgnify:CR=1 FL=1